MKFSIKSYVLLLILVCNGYYTQTQLQSKRTNFLSDNIKYSVLDSIVENAVSYTHLRAHETRHDLVCRLLLEKNFFNDTATTEIYTLHIVGSVRCV